MSGGSGRGEGRGGGRWRTHWGQPLLPLPAPRLAARLSACQSGGRQLAGSPVVRAVHAIGVDRPHRCVMRGTGGTSALVTLYPLLNFERTRCELTL